MKLYEIAHTIMCERLNEQTTQETDLEIKLKCIQSTLENAEKIQYKLSGGKDGMWVDIRQELRRIKNYFIDGYFRIDGNDEDNVFNEFLKNLNYSHSHTYKKGESVGRLPTSDRGFVNSEMPIYRAIGDKILFRGISLVDWVRIKNNGYIDSDMRDAIIETEGINLGQTPRTALYYLPHNDEGVILAISPKNLDLYMLNDEYIRVFEPISIKDVIKVSSVFIKNDEGAILSTNTEKYINDIIDRVKGLGIDINC